MQALFSILLVLTAIFLILLILVQRGRGGGLAGALGGMGGQSAFGTKAGDLFTRITIGAAAFWIVLCIVSVKVLSSPSTSKFTTEKGTVEPNEKSGAPTTGEKSGTDKGASSDKAAAKEAPAGKAGLNAEKPAAPAVPAVPANPKPDVPADGAPKK